MKIFTGKVVSMKMQKTATVLVERFAAHPMYGKRIKKTRKYHVHDEIGVKVGDTVKFVACRPVSKLKRWKVTEVVSNMPEKTERKQVVKKPIVKKVKKGATK